MIMEGMIVFSKLIPGVVKTFVHVQFQELLALLQFSKLQSVTSNSDTVKDAHINRTGT